MKKTVIDQFSYDEKYECWDGNIIVNTMNTLFETEHMSLPTIMDTKQPLSTSDLNTIHYVKEHFHKIYDAFLESLLFWQSKGMRYEIYDEQEYTFEDAYFKTKEDIHPYLGQPLLEILPKHSKENFSYFSLIFADRCLISIEHGLTSLFHKDELIHFDASDIISILGSLRGIEPDCSKWTNNFWLLNTVKNINYHQEPEAAREIWFNQQWDKLVY